MLVDSHCHLDRVDLAPYAGDFSALVDSTIQAGVEHMLCVSINLEDYPSMLKLVEDYPNISVSVGVHPCERGGQEPDEETLIGLAAHPKNVAIGETGLDYFREDGDLTWQHERFRRHIRVARQLNKPLIIHTREAREDTVRILREEQAVDTGGVMHCFTETWEMAKAALDMNFYISFSGILTFKNAQELRDVASKIPLDRILIETDSPYLAPVPYRGKSNQPMYVAKVAEMLADLRGLDVEDISQITRDNFYRLFNRSRTDK